MRALIFEQKEQVWEKSSGFLVADIPTPTIHGKSDARAVIIKVYYAGVCGSDRGIWHRQAFRDQIIESLAKERKNFRTLGHEFFGEVVAVGSEAKRVYKLKKGDTVSAESHVVCNRCFQCRNGQENVCTNEKILGISHDGCFAEYIKVPAHIVWKTDSSKIRPEVAAIQEPFGNAVHAASKVSLKGKTIAIFGLGPIGLFTVLVARGFGAKTIIGVEPNATAGKMGMRLGVDHLVKPHISKKAVPYASDETILKAITNITKGVGVDVAFEMAGYNSSLNNALQSTRRGGDIILFGIKSGNFVLQDYQKLIMRGVTLHTVIGRELWRTWKITKRLLENRENGIHDAIWNIILERGKGTIIPLREYSNVVFEEKMKTHVKLLIKM